MAIYHLSASVVSRAKGQTAIATLAYIEKNREHDDRLERTFDYSKKRDEIAFSETVLPEAAREKYRGKEPGEIWNEFEKLEKRDDAQLAQRLDIALPRELSPAQCRVLAHEWAMQQARDGYAVTLSIHDKPGNRHIDAMRSIRRWNADKDKWGSKYHFVAELDEHGNPIKNPKAGKRGQHLFKGKDVSNIGKEDLLHQRQIWADLCNEHLARAGSSERIDARTLEAQRDEQATLARRAEKAGDLDKMLRHDLAAASLDRDPQKHEFNVNGARRPDIVEHNVIVRDRNAARVKRTRKKVRDQYWNKRARRDRRRRENGADRVAALQAQQTDNRLSKSARLGDDAENRLSRYAQLRPEGPARQPGQTKTPIESLFSNSRPAPAGQGVEWAIYASKGEAAAALGISTKELDRRCAVQMVQEREHERGKRYPSNRRDKLIRALAGHMSKGDGMICVAKQTGKAATGAVKMSCKMLQTSAKMIEAVRSVAGAIPIIGKPLSGLFGIAEAPLKVTSKIGRAITNKADKMLDDDRRDRQPARRGGGGQQQSRRGQQQQQERDQEQERGGGLPAGQLGKADDKFDWLDPCMSEMAKADEEMKEFMREI